MLAKEPRPGRVKTRLSPPCSPEDAAAIAAASLADTFDAALDAGIGTVVAVLDGAPGEWLPPGVLVRPQGAGTFSQRLAAAWAGAAGPALQIGMDTPQLGGGDLAHAAAMTLEHGAAFGPAADGGWWALGLVEPRSDLFDGIRMSTATTGRAQLARLHAVGLAPHMLPTVRDVDTWADALAVGALAPASSFASAVAAVGAAAR